MEMSKRMIFHHLSYSDNSSDRVGCLCGRLKLKEWLITSRPIYVVCTQILSFSSCDGFLLSLVLSVTQPPHQTICSGPQERPPSSELPQARRVSVPHKLPTAGSL